MNPTPRDPRGRKKSDNNPMTAKHAQFCREYLIDLNAGAAAVRAGYAKKASQQIAYRLMEDPRTQAAISAHMAERSKRTEITADRVLTEISYIAFGRTTKLMSWSGNEVRAKNSEELSDEDRALVAEVSETISGSEGQNRSIKLKTHDRVKALELLGRHLGMFKDKVEQTGSLQLIVATNVNGGEK